MTTLESDQICSLVVWADGAAIDYSQEDIDRHGLKVLYELICENRSDDCEVTLYDIDDEEIETVTVGDIREFIYGECAE